MCKIIKIDFLKAMSQELNTHLQKMIEFYTYIFLTLRLIYLYTNLH